MHDWVILLISFRRWNLIFVYYTIEIYSSQIGVGNFSCTPLKDLIGLIGHASTLVLFDLCDQWNLLLLCCNLDLIEYICLTKGRLAITERCRAWNQKRCWSRSWWLFWKSKCLFFCSCKVTRDLDTLLVAKLRMFFL